MPETPITPAPSTSPDALRLDAQRQASLAQQAHDTLARLEEQLTACNESIATHRAALVSHKQQLTADKSRRDELTDTLARQRKNAAQAAKHAAKADSRYDKAVLAQLVLDAKHAAATKAATSTKKTTAAKTSPSSTARKATPAASARSTRKTTGG